MLRLALLGLLPACIVGHQPLKPRNDPHHVKVWIVDAQTTTAPEYGSTVDYLQKTLAHTLERDTRFEVTFVTAAQLDTICEGARAQRVDYIASVTVTATADRNVECTAYEPSLDVKHDHCARYAEHPASTATISLTFYDPVRCNRVRAAGNEWHTRESGLDAPQALYDAQQAATMWMERNLPGT